MPEVALAGVFVWDCVHAVVGVWCCSVIGCHSMGAFRGVLWGSESVLGLLGSVGGLFTHGWSVVDFVLGHFEGYGGLEVRDDWPLNQKCLAERSSIVFVAAGRILR